MRSANLESPPKLQKKSVTIPLLVNHYRNIALGKVGSCHDFPMGRAQQESLVIFPQTLTSALSLWLTFPTKYSWQNVLMLHGMPLRESKIVGYSNLDHEHREFILQGPNSLVRVVLKGRLPLDGQLAYYRLLELSNRPENGIRKMLLHPRRRKRFMATILLGSVGWFWVDFLFRIFSAKGAGFISWPIFWWCLAVGPLSVLGVAWAHRKRVL
jgi:hypothetical protein